jgi:hypothetical protein
LAGVVEQRGDYALVPHMPVDGRIVGAARSQGGGGLLPPSLVPGLTSTATMHARPNCSAITNQTRNIPSHHYEEVMMMAAGFEPANP